MPRTGRKNNPLRTSVESAFQLEGSLQGYISRGLDDALACPLNVGANPWQRTWPPAS